MDKITKQWRLCGVMVDCTYNEKVTPDGKIRINGNWRCDRYGTRKIRGEVKAGTDVEWHLQTKIEKQLMECMRKEQLPRLPETTEKSPTLMGLYLQKQRQFFNEHDWLSSTRDKYDKDYRLRLLCGNLEGISAAQLTEQDIYERMEALAEETQKLLSYKKSRQQKRMQDLWSLLCRFLEFLVREGDLRCNPVPEQKWQELDIDKEQLLPTAREMYNRRFCKQTLTRQESARLLELVEQSENPVALGCALMLLLGMRNGEVCGLNFDCLQITGNGVIFLQVEHQDEKDKEKKANRSITDLMKTKNAYRKLPCSPTVVGLIRRQQERIRRRHPELTEAQLAELPLLWVETQKGRTNLVPGERRATTKDVGTMGRELLEQCMEKESGRILVNEEDTDLEEENVSYEEYLTAYALRHTYCTGLSIASDLTDEEIAYCMGHQSPTGARPRMNEDKLNRLLLAHKAYEAAFDREQTPPEPSCGGVAKEKAAL